MRLDLHQTACRPWNMHRHNQPTEGGIDHLATPSQAPAGRLSMEALHAAGMAALQPMLSREADAQLLEAAVDDVCKLAAESSSRPQLVDAVRCPCWQSGPDSSAFFCRQNRTNSMRIRPWKLSLMHGTRSPDRRRESYPTCNVAIQLVILLQGMIPSLAGLLGIRGQPETLVRALMGIAMLLGNSPGRLQQLAAAPGAVKSMAAIMRGSDDQDSKAIATSIFAALVRVPCCVPLRSVCLFRGCTKLTGIVLLLQRLHCFPLSSHWVDVTQCCRPMMAKPKKQWRQHCSNYDRRSVCLRVLRLRFCLICRATCLLHNSQWSCPDRDAGDTSQMTEVAPHFRMTSVRWQ